MNKQELISAVASKTKCSKSMILGITDTLIETIESALKKGQKVQLVGFGSWQRIRKRARTGRNPQTGKPLSIPAKNVARFSMGQHFFDMLN